MVATSRKEADAVIEQQRRSQAARWLANLPADDGRLLYDMERAEEGGPNWAGTAQSFLEHDAHQLEQEAGLSQAELDRAKSGAVRVLRVAWTQYAHTVKHTSEQLAGEVLSRANALLTAVSNYEQRAEQVERAVGSLRLPRIGIPERQALEAFRDSQAELTFDEPVDASNDQPSAARDGKRRWPFRSSAPEATA